VWCIAETPSTPMERKYAYPPVLAVREDGPSGRMAGRCMDLAALVRVGPPTTDAGDADGVTPSKRAVLPKASLQVTRHACCIPDVVVTYRLISVVSSSQHKQRQDIINTRNNSSGARRYHTMWRAIRIRALSVHGLVCDGI
jgi:hypothetical protein